MDLAGEIVQNLASFLAIEVRTTIGISEYNMKWAHHTLLEIPLENVWGRGKYTLSEREYLWNKRLKGNINIQKTISR